MVIDFKEIPQANLGTGLQDTFELFSRDFLETLGYKIIQHPDRGPDGKKDMIIEEYRNGLSGITTIKWLVSCKHYAHSGKSVSDIQEPNIYDRVISNNCDGFIGFYSTLPSSSLTGNINGLKDKIQIQTFDKEKIEGLLLKDGEGLKLSRRYFPKSFKKYLTENPKPAKIFSNEPSIKCEYCGSELLSEEKKGLGIYVALKKINVDPITGDWETKSFEKAYFSCKGACDLRLKDGYKSVAKYSDSWVDIEKFLNPTGFIKNMLSWMRYLFRDGKYDHENEAYQKYQDLIINTYPFNARESTTEEKEYIKEYMESGLQDFI